MTRARFYIICAVVAFLLVLRFGASLLPTVRTSPDEACSRSPTPAICKAMMTGGPLVDLAGLRDLADPMPPDLAAPPLVACQSALANHWYATAYRAGADAAVLEGIDRVPGLICQGRAAMGLGWPQRALWLAQRAIELQDTAAGHVLAGDALRALRDCRAARVEYLRALDLGRDEEAIKGLRECGSAPPPDLTGDLDLDEGEEGSLA